MSNDAKSAVDKMERYNWKVLDSKPGDFAWVHKEELCVDERYQRPLNDTKRLAIARNFRWGAFGVLTVAKRGDGSLWIVDGQHRYAGACERRDVDVLPCIVFRVEHVEDEARDFLASNVGRKPLTGVDKFQAELTTGDPIAIEIEDLVRRAGRSIGRHTGPRTVSCVRAIRKCLEANPVAFRRVWPTLIAVCEGHAIENRLVVGMHWLEGRIETADGDSATLGSRDNRDHLLRAGYEAIQKSIGSACAYYARGGERVYAEGVLNVLNRRRRKRFRMGSARKDVRA